MDDISTTSSGDEVTKQIPSKPVKSVQYDLFSKFLGDDEGLSNTIELWDWIPKYSVSKRQQNDLRNAEKRLPILKYQFDYKNVPCEIVIQPASVKQPNGSFIDYYPSSREEIIEDVLRKIFTDQQYGLHDRKNGDSWVKFSLHMIYKELKKRKKTLSKNEISEALEILSSAVIKLYIKDKLFYSSAVLSDMVRIGHDEYMEDRDNSWAARLPSILSSSLENLTYRQYNYALGMSLKNHLSRWLYKLLSHQYIYAGIVTPYKIFYSQIYKNSGILTATSTIKDRRNKVTLALEELKVSKVILHYAENRIIGYRGKIDDIEYILMAHQDFIKTTKAANKRQKTLKEELIAIK